MAISKTTNDNNQDYRQAEEMIEQSIASMGEMTHIEYESTTSRNDKPPRHTLLRKFLGRWIRSMGQG